MVKFTLNVEFNLSEHNLVELLWCYISHKMWRKRQKGGKRSGLYAQNEFKKFIHEELSKNVKSHM